MEHFLRTVKVDEEERFLLSLPWLDNHLPLPDNFNLTFKGLQVTNHKLKKENLFKEYGDVVKEWKQEGIIEEVPKEELLARFRLYRFGVLADIRKAFLQISLHQQDQNFLRFLWHSEEGKLIHYTHCRVVLGVSSSPFLLGSTIQYHLEKKLEEAEQGRGKYPECIVHKLISSFYVDNCLASVQTQS
ncbi:reverse transcriptase domain-containing protein [Trichonephila clavipes]|nr:reverse transcriptase domain-containing protein [Trichonephila clavipes]